MKKLFILSIITIIISSCSTSNVIIENGKAYGSKNRIGNPNKPYTYKKGFKDFEIKPILSIQENDSVYINELRFYAVFDAKYTKKFMFEKFGKWHKAIKSNNKRHPVLVWENIKLFENENKLYSVATKGHESREETYTAVIVFDDENRDCLAKNHPKKTDLINYFGNGIINLSSSRKFYKVYRDHFLKDK